MIGDEFLGRPLREWMEIDRLLKTNRNLSLAIEELVEVEEDNRRLRGIVASYDHLLDKLNSARKSYDHE